MRKMGLLIAAFLFAALTGCSMADAREAFEGKVGEYVLRRSGIPEDASYAQYQNLKEQGKIDGEGLYRDLGEYAQAYAADASGDETEKGQVHVTFAKNRFLEAAYFYDEGQTEPVEGDGCYLDVGESLYAPQPRPVHPYTNAYFFSGFRICAYDAAGNRREIKELFRAGGKVLTIPEGFSEQEISVEPVGEYRRRTLSFQAYRIDKDGNRKTSDGGTWKVNGQESLGNTADIGPGEAYIVKYCYDPEAYYVSAAEPEYYSDRGGVVEFPRMTALQETPSYCVELRPYLAASLEGDHGGLESIRSVEVNGVKREWADAKIEKLRAGDRILMETAGGYRLSCAQFALGDPETLRDGTARYSFEVPQGQGEMLLYVSRTMLTVELEESVGADLLFDIGAYELSWEGCRYQAQAFRRAHTAVDAPIGTEAPVTISARGSALPAGHALRLDIERKDGSGRAAKEIAYLADLSGIFAVSVREEGSAANFNRIYREIYVRISLVETYPYRQESVADASIELRFADVDGGAKLRDGDIADGTREVEVAIQPAEGYYVSGKKVSGDSYRERMTFQRYRSGIAEIIQGHPVRKLIWVTLDASDAHGTCVFTVDGEEKNGKTGLRAGQKIVLEYTLTDLDYEIVREQGGFLDQIITWGSEALHKNRQKVTIEVTEGLDGTTLTRADYVKVDRK